MRLPKIPVLMSIALIQQPSDEGKNQLLHCLKSCLLVTSARISPAIRISALFLTISERLLYNKVLMEGGIACLLAYKVTNKEM